MPIYKCENYSNCASADTGKPIELASAVEPKCPVCSAPLKSQSGDSSVEGRNGRGARGRKTGKDRRRSLFAGLAGRGVLGVPENECPGCPATSAFVFHGGGGRSRRRC